MIENNGNTAVIDPATPKAEPTPDIASVFYGGEQPKAEAGATVVPSAPKTDGTQAPADEPTPAPAEAPKAEVPPKGTEDKGADDQRKANRRLGNELKEAKDQLTQATEQIKLLQSKLDGTYQEPPKPTQEQVLAQERFRAKEQASRSIAIERFGEEAVNQQIYDKESKFNEVAGKKPYLAQRVLHSELPAVEAMLVLSEESFKETYGADSTKWREKIEAELRPIILEEFKKQAAAQPVGSPAPTVSEARGTGGGRSARTLEEVFYPGAKS